MSCSKYSVTKYNRKYELEFSWVTEDPAFNSSARCTLCKTTISLGRMGRTALRSHAKSAKHVAAENITRKCSRVDMLFKKNGTDSSSASTSTGRPDACGADVSTPKHVGHKTPPCVVKHYLLSEDVTKAEVIWCLQTVMNHSPFRSAGNFVSCFPLMFPDSQIAPKIQLQRTKIAYTIVHGLSPYFKNMLNELIKNCKYIVIGFDESLNKISQQQQMDLHIRFWNEDEHNVSTRYYTSVFLGKTTAADLLEGLKTGATNELIKKLIQLSMDGPNVNLKLLKDLCAELREGQDGKGLLNIGSCGLHTVHGAFKLGIRKLEWGVVEFLRALYYVFKDAPARRADFTKVTGSTTFPLKFCAVRWVENVAVATRALLMLPHVDKYVTEVKKVNNSLTTTSNSFKVVSTALRDKLLASKLTFFVFVASMVEPFLREFQTNAPMVPFLHGELTSLVRLLLDRVVKNEVLQNCVSVNKVDLQQVNNLIPLKKIDVGFSTRSELKKLVNVSELQVTQFYKDCQNCIIQVVQKLMIQSPLKFRFTKAASCLDPSVIVRSMNIAEQRMASGLEVMVENNLISGLVADKMKEEYRRVCSNSTCLEKLKSFRRSETALDKFWMEVMHMYPDSCANLLEFVKMVLIMSHGNAFLERGFSVNSECLLENQKTESLVALRQVHDAVTAAGGVHAVQVTKSLIHAARNAHARYVEAMEKKRNHDETQLTTANERKRLTKELSELETKKMKLLSEAKNEAQLIEEQIRALSNKLA